jgi:hypothetical protein
MPTGKMPPTFREDKRLKKGIAIRSAFGRMQEYMPGSVRGE